MRSNRLYAVIHVLDLEQSLRNSHIARDSGADGIFLINHGVSYVDLLHVYERVRLEHGLWWIGLNMLDLKPPETLDILPRTVDALWVDDGGIQPVPGGGFLVDRAVEMHRLLRSPGFNGLTYFGGVAFKGQDRVSDYAGAAGLATRYMDVVTTSGPGTGHQPDVEKIRLMREAIGHFPLAVASGMTPENVDPFLELVDYFLVATGINSSFTELDPKRVRMMADKMVHC